MVDHALFSADKQIALRSWLKLLGTSNFIRKSLQSHLQAIHGVSLSRFDVLANLYRAPEQGVRLTDLSKNLMVSNGNVTQVLAPLIKEGLVARAPCPNDARAAIATLTRKGRTLFESMAADHALWVADIFADFSQEDHIQLASLIDKLDPDKITKD